MISSLIDKKIVFCFSLIYIVFKLDRLRNLIELVEITFTTKEYNSFNFTRTLCEHIYDFDRVSLPNQSTESSNEKKMLLKFLQ